MKILFYVDHKYRDLPALAKIGYYLKNKNYKVYYSALWNWQASYDKDIIILPKPIFQGFIYSMGTSEDLKCVKGVSYFRLNN